jgi:hypothetical protein
MTTETSTAETLRRAAAQMREQAEAVERDGGGWFAAENLRGVHEPVNADHIAAWSPAVGLAVADLLDVWIDYDLLTSSVSLPGERAAIVAIARTYLGDE